MCPEQLQFLFPLSKTYPQLQSLLSSWKFFPQHYDGQTSIYKKSAYCHCVTSKRGQEVGWGRGVLILTLVLLPMVKTVFLFFLPVPWLGKSIWQDGSENPTEHPVGIQFQPNFTESVQCSRGLWQAHLRQVVCQVHPLFGQLYSAVTELTVLLSLLGTLPEVMRLVLRELNLWKNLLKYTIDVLLVTQDSDGW